MTRIWGVMVLGLVAVSAMAAPPQQKANQKRVDAIWNFAVDRINRQNDIWFEDGDFPRVINMCRVMYALYPGDYEVATNLGWMLENIEHWDEALAVYIKFRNDNPADPDSAWPEANFYYMKKVYEKVPALLEPTLKMARKPHPNTYRTLAHSYERMNQLADSQRVWKSYLQIAPDDAPAKNNLTRVEKKLRGDWKEKQGG